MKQRRNWPIKPEFNSSRSKIRWQEIATVFFCADLTATKNKMPLSALKNRKEKSQLLGSTSTSFNNGQLYWFVVCGGYDLQSPGAGNQYTSPNQGTKKMLIQTITDLSEAERLLRSGKIFAMRQGGYLYLYNLRSRGSIDMVPIK